MLVLARKKNEGIVISDDIEIVVVEIRGDKVRLGVNAPMLIPVHRREVYDAIHKTTSDIPAACVAPEHREKSPVAETVEEIEKAIEIIEDADARKSDATDGDGSPDRQDA